MNTKYAQPGLAREPEAVASSNPFRKYQVITVSLLLVIGIINYVDRSALSIANTSIQRDMGITPSQMGILLSAFSLAYAFSQLPLGMIIDRLGSKIALGASLLAWSVAQATFGMVNSFAGFMGLRVLLGIGEAPMFPSAAKALSEWFDANERGTPTGIVWSSTCLGPCLAPPLLTLFMVNFGWRGMFIITGVIGIVLALCWLMFYKSKAQYLAELAAHGHPARPTAELLQWGHAQGNQQEDQRAQPQPLSQRQHGFLQSHAGRHSGQIWKMPYGSWAKSVSAASRRPRQMRTACTVSGTSWTRRSCTPASSAFID